MTLPDTSSRTPRTSRSLKVRVQKQNSSAMATFPSRQVSAGRCILPGWPLAAGKHCRGCRALPVSGSEERLWSFRSGDERCLPSACVANRQRWHVVARFLLPWWPPPVTSPVERQPLRGGRWLDRRPPCEHLGFLLVEARTVWGCGPRKWPSSDVPLEAKR